MGLGSMALSPAILAAAALLPIIYLVASWALAARRPKNFPPGPPPVLGLGNVLEIPPEKAFLKFHEWKQTYGDLLGLKIGAQNVVVLHGAEHVRELFEKRGSVYSDRTQPYITSRLINPGTMIFMNNDHTIKKVRTALRNIFAPAELRRVHVVQTAQAALLMRRLLDRPGQLHAHLKHWALATPLAVVSGQECKDSGPTSPPVYFGTQDKWLRFLTPAQAPPVDLFPVLKYFPEFLARWKREALALRKDMLKMMYHMLEGANMQHAKISKGIQSRDRESLMTRLLIEGEKSKDMKFGRHELALLGAGTLDAAVDTAIATTSSMILVLGAFPEVQKRLQAEVDSIWHDEVPGPEGLTKAKYLKAIMMEVMRWRSATPTGVPRVLARDDTYQGFTFPKGTMFILNTWSIHRDERWFDRPEEFVPERYLDNAWGVRPSMAAAAEKQNRRPTYNFGAGRRMCPGLDYAENQVLVTMAKLAWEFDVVARGKLDCDVVTGYHSDLIMAPKPYDVDLVPRNEERRNKIVEDCNNAERVLSEWVH